MLTAGIDHVATITKDSDRLQRFYVENFGASIEFDGPEFPGGPRMTIINIGPDCEFNVFEIEGNTEADNQTPMYGRGRIDHIGLLAASLEEFSEIRERLMAAGSDRRHCHRVRAQAQLVLPGSRPDGVRGAGGQPRL